MLLAKLVCEEVDCLELLEDVPLYAAGPRLINPCTSCLPHTSTEHSKHWNVILRCYSRWNGVHEKLDIHCHTAYTRIKSLILNS